MADVNIVQPPVRELFPCELSQSMNGTQSTGMLFGGTELTNRVGREDKLLWDACELGSGKLRSRLPVFVQKWFVWKFGKNKFCEQQMVDLICT